MKSTSNIMVFAEQAQVFIENLAAIRHRHRAQYDQTGQTSLIDNR